MKRKLKSGFGKAKMNILQSDLPIREFAAKLSNLYVRSACFENENKKLLILSIEMTSLTDRDIVLFKKMITEEFKFSPEEIWISATHTFSAPHLKHELQNEADKQTCHKFLGIIQASIINAVQAAIEDLAETSLSIGYQSCPLNVNRNILTDKGWWLGRNLAGFSDHQVRVVQFVQSNGHKNLFFNYDLQPSVFDHVKNDQDQRVITGDLFGQAAIMLEKHFNVAIPLIGCAGDQRPLFQADNNEAYEVNQSLLQKQSLVLTEAIKLAVDQSKHCHNNKFDVFKLDLQLPSQKQQRETFEIKPEQKYQYILSEDQIPVSLLALRIGEWVLVGTQPELNSSFGDKCRRLINSNNIFITTLLDGGKKYLPE